MDHLVASDETIRRVVLGEVAEQAGVDRKTSRRYLAAAAEAGLPGMVGLGS